VDLVIAGVEPAEVEGAVSTEEETPGRCRVTLPPRATREVVLPIAAQDRLEGVNEINLAMLLPRLRALRLRAAQLGVDPQALELPEPDEWREAVAETEQWETLVWETENTAVAYRHDDVVVDGRLDEWRDLPPAGNFARRVGVDFAQDAEPLRGTHFWAGWDDEHLYIAARVEDAVVSNTEQHEMLWNGDALELGLEFILEPERAGGEYDADTYQLILAPTSAMGRPASYMPAAHGRTAERDPVDIKVKVVVKDMAWSLEAAIPWRRFLPAPPQANTVFGFVVALDRSDGGDRHEQRLWRGEGDFSRNRLSFARLRLAPAMEADQ
jgi:hypothetical protein